MGKAIPLLTCMLLLSLGAPAAHAEKCVIDSPYGGRVEYDCSASADEGTAASDEPWWANNTTQAVLAVVGLAGSAAAGGYTWLRLKQRRRTLADYVLAVERTYTQHKASPDAGVPRLIELRGEVRARHEKGRLEDAQFFELDKRITDYIARLRLADIDRRFGGLPPGLLGEIRHVIADGNVTQEDCAFVDRMARHHQVPDGERARLVAALQAWTQEDGATKPPAAPEPAPRMALRP